MGWAGAESTQVWVGVETSVDLCVTSVTFYCTGYGPRAASTHARSVVLSFTVCV